MASFRKSLQGAHFNEDQITEIKLKLKDTNYKLALKVADFNGLENLRRQYYGNIKSRNPTDLRSEAGILESKDSLQREIQDLTKIVEDMEIRLAAVQSKTQG